MENDWISLHRKFKNWKWYKDINTKTLFLHLLLNANFKNNYWNGIIVERGQLATSIKHLSDETGLTERQTRTALSKLKSTGEITIKTTNKYSLITIKKYSFYQQNNNKTTSKTTNKMTNERQAKSKKTTTNNNDIQNNIIINLINKYKAKIKGKNFHEKIKLISLCKEEEDYKRLDSNLQDYIFEKLMILK